MQKNSLGADIIIQAPDNALSVKEAVLGFDLYEIPYEYRRTAADRIVEWLEENGIACDDEYTVIMINMYKEMNDAVFIRKLKPWKANIVAEYTCSRFDATKELDYLRNKSDWFTIPVFERIYRVKAE